MGANIQFDLTTEKVGSIARRTVDNLASQLRESGFSFNERDLQAKREKEFAVVDEDDGKDPKNDIGIEEQDPQINVDYLFKNPKEAERRFSGQVNDQTVNEIEIALPARG